MSTGIFQTDSDINISLGKVPGYTAAFGFGSNRIAVGGAEETIWDFGGLYTYLTADTTVYGSSSSVADVGQELTAVGVDVNRNVVLETVTLNGQNQVAFSGDFFRIFTVANSGSTDLNGDVYIAESDTLTAGVPDTDSKVKSFIPVGENITKNGMFTTPVGRSALFNMVRFTVGKNESGLFLGKLRQEGGVFQHIIELEIYQGNLAAPLVPPVVIPEKADIEFSFIPDNGGVPVSVGFDMYLVAESLPFGGLIPTLMNM